MEELSFYQMINLFVVVKQNKIDIKTVLIFIFMRPRKLKKRWLIYRPPGMKGLREAFKKTDGICQLGGGWGKDFQNVIF